MTAVETQTRRAAVQHGKSRLDPNQGVDGRRVPRAEQQPSCRVLGGVLEVLAMPTEQHQLIVLFLYRILFAFVNARQLGTVLTAPLRVRLWEGKFREPDVVFLLAQHADRRGNQYRRGADLVIEVVSEDDPVRDLVSKRGICPCRNQRILDRGSAGPDRHRALAEFRDGRLLRGRTLCVGRGGPIGAAGRIFGRRRRSVLADLKHVY